MAVISFVCSVGNVPLAAVLWQGGISFGGVVSFIFADLIVLLILDIYRRYYGWKASVYIFATFYATMALAGYVVEIVFAFLGIIPANRQVEIISQGPSWNYTTYLNIFFLIVAAVLVWRFLRTGGPEMLRMMNGDGQYGGHAGHDMASMPMDHSMHHGRQIPPAHQAHHAEDAPHAEHAHHKH